MRKFIAWACLFAITGFAANEWPQWRGPNFNGVAPGDVPLEWGPNKNVAWKVEIPGRGFSSPVIWGDRLFLTTAVPTEQAASAGADSSPGGGGRRGAGGGAAAGVQHKFLVMAFDRHTGKELWLREALTATPHEGYHARYGSFASNSPATDGKYVYAFFGSRGLFVYDIEGKLVWKKEFPPMRMRLAFGEGAAPTLDGNRLYLKFDQEQGSYLLALDARTGKELWRAERPDEASSWSQPLVLTHNGKKQLIVSASSKVRSYDPETGKVIWEAAGLGSNVIPTPVTANGMVYVMSGHRDPKLMAIQLGREGDLTGTDAILWTNDRGNSYTASPVLHEGKLYFITDTGMLSVLDARTGEAHYRQQRLPKPYNFKASPVAVNKKLYLSTEEGDVVVVRMGDQYDVLATNSLGENMFISSPAVAGNSLYLRTQDALYCIREK